MTKKEKTTFVHRDIIKKEDYPNVNKKGNEFINVDNYNAKNTIWGS